MNKTKLIQKSKGSVRKINVKHTIKESRKYMFRKEYKFESKTLI